MTIDVHNHFIVEGIEKKVQSKYATSCPQICRIDGIPFLFTDKNDKHPTLAERVFESHWSIDVRLKDMAKTSVDVQLLSIVPYFNYSKEIDAAKEICRAENDGIAKIARDHQGRFFGLADVPLQDAQQAAEELERAMHLDGIVGVQIGASINGMNLDDPRLNPFYSTAERLQAPILVHPTGAPGVDRLQKYNLRNMIGNPLDTTIAVASVVFGGVLELFPNLKFCFVHGGGFAPYQKGRFTRGFKVRSEAKNRLTRPPEDYLSRIYFDTVIHYEPALRYMVEAIGARQIVMGSDYPADMGDPDPVQFITNSQLKMEDKKRILSENAIDLFRLNTKMS